MNNQSHKFNLLEVTEDFTVRKCFFFTSHEHDLKPQKVPEMLYYVKVPASLKKFQKS